MNVLQNDRMLLKFLNYNKINLCFEYYFDFLLFLIVSIKRQTKLLF